MKKAFSILFLTLILCFSLTAQYNQGGLDDEKQESYTSNHSHQDYKPSETNDDINTGNTGDEEDLSQWSSGLLPSEYPPGYVPPGSSGSGESSGTSGSPGTGGSSDNSGSSGDSGQENPDSHGGNGSSSQPSGNNYSGSGSSGSNSSNTTQPEPVIQEPPAGDVEEIQSEQAKAALSEEKIAEIVKLDAKRAKLQSTLITEQIRTITQSTESDTLQAETVSRREESLNAQIDEIKTQISEIIGDPVYVTTGQFYDSTADLGIRYLIQTYDLTRTYSPDSSQDGCFGQNWISSLDSRLVFGLDTITQHDCNSFYNNEITPLQKSLDKLIDTYTSSFGKSSDEWSDIAFEINSKLADLDELVMTLANQLHTATVLVRNNAGTKSAENAVQLYTKITYLINEALSLQTDYKTYAALCIEYDQLIREYQITLENRDQAYQALLSRVEHNNTISVKNGNALLPGTKDQYRTTGLETITLIDDTGVPHAFSSPSVSAGQGAPFAPSGTTWNRSGDSIYESITKTAGGYELSLKNGSRRSFSEEGLLLSCTDAYGNWIRFSRDSTGKVTEISTCCGTAYALSYNGRRITSISRKGENKPLVQYSYNGSRLSAVTDSDGYTLRYKWDDGRISGMMKSDGSSITFSYDEVNSEGQLLTTATVNEEGFSEHYVYDFARKTTEHSDYAGVKTLYVYDDLYRTNQIIHADGSTTLYFYDSANRKTQTRNSDGTGETWRYDDQGNVISHTGTDGVSYSYARNNAGDILYCYADGAMLFSCTYSSSGLCTSETVYSSGTPITTTFAYDKHGNLTKATTGSKVEEWEWDDSDNPTCYKVNGKQLLSFQTGNHDTTITAYNGFVTKATTNARKDVVSVEERDSITGEKRITEYEYDRRHLVTAMYSGDGTVRTLVGRYRHDGAGKIEAAISYRGEAAVIEYYDYVSDAGIRLSEPVSIIRFSLSSETVSDYGLRSQEGFENADIQALSRISTDRRIICPADTSDGSKASGMQTESHLSFSYSDDRRVLTVSEGGLYETTYTLNAWEEPVSKTDGNGNTTTFSYDFSGNLISCTDPYGNTTSCEYDEAGQITDITYPDGSWEHFTYDAAGNLTKAADQAGVIIEQDFDEMGNLVRKSGRRLTETSFTYDAQNRLSNVYEAGMLIMHYEYLQNDQVIRTDAKGNRIPFEESAVRSVPVTTDDAGNISEVHDDDSHLVYEYDAGNKLVRQKNLVTGYEITYEYDKAGNRTVMADGSRTVMYEYGCNNELTGITELKNGLVSSSVSFSYDCLGRETMRTYGNGVTQTTSYDEAGNVRLIIQRDANGSLVWGEGFLFDENGRISARISSDSSLSIMNYDSRGRLSCILEADRSIPAEEKAETVYLSPEVYYGLQSLLDQMQLTLGNALTVLQAMRRTEYEYDANSNRIAEKTGQSLIVYEYDEENRLIRAGDTTYTYDEAGNMTKETSSYRSVQNEYSEGNRLLSSHVTDALEMTDIITSYGYDALGRRISETNHVRNSDGLYSVTDRLNYEYSGFSLEITGVFR